MKKSIFTALAFIFFISAIFPFPTRSSAKNEARLLCDGDGNFTILVVSDPQCDTAAQWNEAKTELETLVERASPDLVIINGDMNSNNIIPADMWELFISPLTERGIYWATTNGNHDPFKQKYYKMYKGYEKCLNSLVDISDPNYEPSRPMNYVIPIYSNDGKAPVFAVYGMDSGTENKNGYEGVTKRQIKWYESRSDELKEKNGGTPVISLLCMHIPLPQVIDMYYSANDGTSYGKNLGGIYPVYGILNESNVGVQNYICENKTLVLNSWFDTTAKENDRGLFDSVLNKGDVRAIIFGHDHKTNIVGSYKDVILGFAGKLSTGCYSDKLCRGGRVIRFNQSAPESFTVSWLGALKTSKDQPAIRSDGSVITP